MKSWQATIYRNLIHGNRNLMKGGVKRQLTEDEPHLLKAKKKWIYDEFFIARFDDPVVKLHTRDECVDELDESVGGFVYYVAEARLLQRIHQDFWSDHRDRLDGTATRLENLIQESQRRGHQEMEAMAEAWLSEMCERRNKQSDRKAHLARSLELANGIEDATVLAALVPRFYANIGLQWGKPFERIKWIRTAVLQTVELAKRLPSSNNKHVLKMAFELLPRLHHNLIHLGEISVAEQTAAITQDLALQVRSPDSGKELFFCQITNASSSIDAGYYDRADTWIAKCRETLKSKRIPRNLKTSFQVELLLLRLRLLEKQERYFEFTEKFIEDHSAFKIQPNFYLQSLTMAARVAYENHHDELMQKVLPPLAATCHAMADELSMRGAYFQGVSDPDGQMFEQLTPFYYRAQLAIAQGVHEYDLQAYDGVHSAYGHLSDARSSAERIMSSVGWQLPEFHLAYAETLMALGKHLQHLGEHHNSLSRFKAAIALGEKTTWSHDTIEARVPHTLEALSGSVDAHLLCGYIDEALGELVQAEQIANAADKRGQNFPPVIRVRMMRCRASILLFQGRYEDAVQLATQCWNFTVTEFGEGRPQRSKIRELVKIAEVLAESVKMITSPADALETFRHLTVNFDVPEIAQTVEGQRAKLSFLSIESTLLAEAGQLNEASESCDEFDSLATEIDPKRFFIGYMTARIKTVQAMVSSKMGDDASASKRWIDAAHAWSSNFRFSYAPERTLCYLKAAEALVSQIKASGEDANFEEASLWSQQAIESIATMRQFVTDPLKRLEIQKKWLRAYEVQAELFHLSRGTEYFGWNLNTYLQNSEAVRCRASTDLLSAPVIAEGDCPPWLKGQLETARTSIQGNAVARTSGDPNSSYSLPPNLRDSSSDDNEERELGADDLEDRIHQFIMAQRTIQQNTFKNVSYDADLDVKDIDEIQSLLPSRTALLNFDVKDNFTTVLIFSRDGYRVRKLDDVNRSVCAKLASRWRSAYAQSRNANRMPDLAAWNRHLDSVLVEVSERVLLPILGEFGGVDSLCVVPNRELHIFPWHALPINGASRLIDIYDVSTAPSVTILKYLYGLQEQPGEVLLMAAKRRDQQLAPMEGVGLERLLGVPCRASGGIEFEDLVQQSQTASIWHYAGHAGHGEQNPLESLLTNVTPDKTNLKLRDVCSRFSFPAMQLATISGCETAMLIPNDLDEYVSFPLAFHCAGARNVISCLWSADQLACPLFFLHLYRSLQDGLTIAAAYRSAIRWLRGEGEGSLKTIADVRRELQQSFWTHEERSLARNKWERRFDEWVDEGCESAPFSDTSLWAPFTCSGLAWRQIPFTFSKASGQ